MSNISIFCLTLDPDHEEVIKKLSTYRLVLEKKFSNQCFTDKSHQNISEKPLLNGEYTLFIIGYGKII